MSTIYKVLKKLQEGNALSGQNLADELGVSRNSIWKAVNSLRKNGYEIAGRSNSGYKLLHAGDALTKESIEKYLNVPNITVDVLDSVNSTNDALKSMAQTGAPHGLLLVAKEQLAGKGRLGRKFSSPFGTGVYMSVLLRPTFSADEALSITTAAAVAVAKTLEKLSSKKAMIKWVNDIFIEDRKVCGILTEAAVNFENATLDYAVLGIGINLAEPENGFSEDIKSIAGPVFVGELPTMIRAKTIALVLNNFFDIYNTLPNKDFINEYRERSYLTGKEVVMNEGNNQFRGTVSRIDENAKLVIKLGTGEERAFSHGEATIEKNILPM